MWQELILAPQITAYQQPTYIMQEALVQVQAPPPPKKDMSLAEICNMQQLFLFRICNINRLYKQPKIWKTIAPLTK